ARGGSIRNHPEHQCAMAADRCAHDVVAGAGQSLQTFMEFECAPRGRHGLPVAYRRVSRASKDESTMTTVNVAEIVRAVLSEYALPDTLKRVAALPFSWEVTLRSPAGVEQHVIIPFGSPRTLPQRVRIALEPHA